MVTRPPQTGPSHLLPFGQLSPDQFERLTLWLVGFEGYLAPQHWGQRGKDSGRDIIARKAAGGDTQEIWYFQCKRYEKLTAGDLKDEADKILGLAARSPDKRPAGIVFVTSCDVPAPARDTVEEYCASKGYKCEFWAGSELDRRVKRHAELLKEFFELPAERPMASAEPGAIGPESQHAGMRAPPGLPVASPETGAIGPESQHAGMRAAPGVAQELPAPPADFTGREKGLRVLMAGIGSGGVTTSGDRGLGGVIISGVRGLGGIGKTALALKLGELLKPQFRDGQLYVNLKGFGGGKPLTPAQAQAQVITAYHPEVKIPEDPGAVAGLYRSTLSGKRALLLMDNALDAEQVEPLIPPPDSVLIVTSRDKFTLPGLRSTELDVLRVEDARGLLLKIAPRIGALADEIARLCGRLALALRAAASLIADTPALEPAEYVTRLGDERTRLGRLRTDNPELDVQASITVSYNLLDRRSQRVLRDLSVFPGSFDRAAALAVCEDPDHRRLDGLVRRSLVDFNVEPERYHLHDLVRVFARSTASEQESESAARRHSLHFLAVLWECDRFYKQGGEDMLAGLRLIDLEWSNIEAGQAWAERRSRDDDEAARACSGYADAGVHILDLRQHPRDWIAWLLPAAAAAQKLRDRSGEGRHLGNLGIAHKNLGEFRRAIEFHERALDIDRETADRRGEGQDLGSLGIVYKALGEFRRAIEFHEQHLAIARETGDRLGEGIALGNLGNSYDCLGEHRHAIEFHEQHLAIAREIGDRSGEGTALWNLSQAFDQIGERGRAIQHAEASLKIRQEIEDPRAAQVRDQLAEWNAPPD